MSGNPYRLHACDSRAEDEFPATPLFLNSRLAGGLLIGFGLIGLASVADSAWPLFVRMLPYALCPRIAVNADGQALATGPVTGEG